MITPADEAVVAAQLGRVPRGVRAVAHRCSCGLPDVVETAPRLPDGTPFPTLYYLTCPRAAAAISGLEAAGLMREMTARLADDDKLRASYQRAHADYLARRDAAAAGEGQAPLPPGTQTAGGMPERVKCLHALVAHELAVPEANPLGREAIEAAGPWWARGRCVAGLGGGGEAGGSEPAADVRLSPGGRRDQAGCRYRLRHELHQAAHRRVPRPRRGRGARQPAAGDRPHPADAHRAAGRGRRPDRAAVGGGAGPDHDRAAGVR